MKWKGYTRKLPWPNLRYYPGIHLKRLRITTELLSQDNLFSRLDLNPGHPKKRNMSANQSAATFCNLS